MKIFNTLNLIVKRIIIQFCLRKHLSTFIPESDNFIPFNPIPAEVLENQDTLGGGQFDPPPL